MGTGKKFARVYRFLNSTHYYVAVGEFSSELMSQEKTTKEAEKINQAFRARLKSSLEAFREKAALVAETHCCDKDCQMDKGGGCFACDQKIAKAIRRLPVEGEE